MTRSGNGIGVWASKWRWYHRDLAPWRRLELHRRLARAGSFARMPLHGEPLELLRDGRLVVGEGSLFEPFVWLTGGESGRITIGPGVILNLGVMVAALDSVSIGERTMVANGSVITDSNHRFDDRERWIMEQGFSSKGATTIGADCWIGANCVITSGVSIGDRSVVGANSVVTRDVPSGSVVAGAPGRVIGQVPSRLT